MNQKEPDDLFVQVHRLVAAVLEQPESAAGRELTALLQGNARARELYVAYMHETAGLHWQAEQMNALDAWVVSKECDATAMRVGSPSQLKQRSSRNGLLLAAAASLLTAVALGYWFTPPGSETWRVTEREVANGGAARADVDSPAREVATLTRLINARWGEGTTEPPVLSRLRIGQRLELAAGQAEIVFDSGVELVLTGECDMQIVSPCRVVSSKGTYSAHVGKRGKGFTIETPTARVVDLGTQFGLAIDDAGTTEVAVFRGVVNLTSDVSLSGMEGKVGPSKRLTQGEALRVDRGGRFERVVSIASDRFPVVGASDQLFRGKPVIAAVSDNIRSGQSNKFYRIARARFRDDAEAFVDREHEWNGLDADGLPTELVGADYVMPFNDDKFVKTLEVRVELAGPAVLYVLFDDNMDRPEWLVRDFVDTGLDVGLDQAATHWRPHMETKHGGGVSIDNVFSVWKREVHAPSTIVLGSVEAPAVKDRGYNMYGIVATPLAPELSSR